MLKQLKEHLNLLINVKWYKITTKTHVTKIKYTNQTWTSFKDFDKYTKNIWLPTTHQTLMYKFLDLKSHENEEKYIPMYN